MLAQLVEHLLDVQEVTGSSPVPSTKRKPEAIGPGFLFCPDIAEADLFESCTAAQPRRVLRTKQPRYNESEALPAADTAELELGQPSKFMSTPRRAT